MPGHTQQWDESLVIDRVILARKLSTNLQNVFSERPLSLLTAMLAIGVIAFSIYQRLRGQIYLQGVGWMDAFTPVMISLLLLQGLFALKDSTDLQAVSIALIGALSFIFAYEAIYKLSFYFPPHRMSGVERREFLIQSGIALTALAGFAFGKFNGSKRSMFFLGLFTLIWIFWLWVGFPQVDNPQPYYAPVIQLDLSWPWIYTINRATKVAFFFAYFFLYDPPET